MENHKQDVELERGKVTVIRHWHGFKFRWHAGATRQQRTLPEPSTVSNINITEFSSVGNHAWVSIRSNDAMVRVR